MIPVFHSDYSVILRTWFRSVTLLERQRRKLIVTVVVMTTLLGGLFVIGRNWAAGWCNSCGQVALSNRELEQAQGWYRWGSWLGGESGKSLMGLARVERLSGRPQEMQRYLQQAEVCGIPIDQIRREYLLSEIQSGRIRELQRDLPELLIKAGEDAPAVSEALASGYFQAYRIKDALALLAAWQRDYPDDPQPFFVRGSYYLQRQSWNNAATEFEQALKLNPRRTDIRLLWAECLYNLQKLEASRQQFEQCLQAAPRNSVAMIGVGRCLFETGEIAKARIILERALTIAPDSWEGRFYLGKLLAADDRPKESLVYLEAICRERPYVPNARYALALALKAAKQDSDADVHFQYVMEQQQAQSELRNKLEMLEREPRRTDLRLEIGRTLLKYGNPEEGRGWLQSVLEIDPRNAAAVEALAGSSPKETPPP